jgi:hypothetical protein
MDGNRMRTGTYTTLSATTEYEAFMFKMKSYPPPWTWDLVFAYSDIPTSPYFLNVSMNSRYQVQSGLNNTLQFNIGSAGVTVPPVTNMVTAINTFDPTGPQEIHMQMKLDLARMFTFDCWVDGAHPTIASGATPPQTVEFTEAIINTGWTQKPYWPVAFNMFRGGWVDYIESWVRPGV